MNTKNIFNRLALAMLMPAMLLTTACSNSNDDAIINNDQPAKKGYALPVTVNVTRQGDDATTRATYDSENKKLAFSSGDKLFVKGLQGEAGYFAGTLDYVPAARNFSGTIYTENQYSETAQTLLAGAEIAEATLLPDGYDEDYHYLSISGEGYSATLATDATKAFATTKAAAVEQFSLEQAEEYDNGFALSPSNAILNFTVVTGQWGEAPASSTVSLQVGSTTISGSVTPEERDIKSATATFAVAVSGSTDQRSCTLTVDGTSVSLGSHVLTAGKIYNQRCANINKKSPYMMPGEKWLIYGTGESVSDNIWISGTSTKNTTVTLSNVNLEGGFINCDGVVTIILADGTTNTVIASDTEDPGYGVAIRFTTAGPHELTIKGTGTLEVIGGPDSPAIGNGYPTGNAHIDINIENTVHLSAMAGEGESESEIKAISTGLGDGTLTIGGVVYPNGAASPFIYPIPPATGHALTSAAVGEIICSDGLAYDADDKDNLPTGVTAVAMIAYMGADSNCSNGLAIALENVGNGNSWDNSNNNNDGKTAAELCSAWNTSKTITGGTWRLPSVVDWQYMLVGCGATGPVNVEPSTSFYMSYSGMETMLTAVGGAALTSFWTSTPSGSYAWYVNFPGGGNALIRTGSQSGSNGVRACLAF